MLKGLFILDEESFNKIYGPMEREEIAKYVDIYAPPQTADSIRGNPGILHSAEVIFSGWGAPLMDADFLSYAPDLKAVFYGAGTIKYFTTDAFWDRNILITSAYAANAVPVAEYTLSQILFCLKRGWHFAAEMKKRCYPERDFIPGAYGSTIGIISLGTIGRMVCEMLKNFDLSVIAYDPFVNEEDAKALNVELCPLDEVFTRADVVSLHTPWLKETENMIQGGHFAAMKPYASFINTARGAVVNEKEMIRVLENRPDIQAVLDVTWPEPPERDSPLYSLPNVVLTPHIAGSMNGECRRMGRYMVQELNRYIKGEPLKWVVAREKAQLMA